MRIVADENIPFIKDYFDQCGELILKPGRQLVRHDVESADMLILRSVTPVNKELLQDTAVKFVGCVSTGVDHIDAEWLSQAGISWHAAEGCNAIGVAEYVVTVIAALEKMEILSEKKRRAAVVGVGRIGSQVAEKLKILGFEVLLCDPLRAQVDKDFVSTPFAELKDLDFISLHTPLTKTGQYPTYHMVDRTFIQRQNKNCVVLNAGRGSVVDFSDLKEYGETLYWCLDVWENEPMIDFEVLALADIATPHIAGYTVESKYRAIDMVYQAACKQMKLPDRLSMTPPKEVIDFSGKAVDWRDVVLSVYDPRETTAVMKKVIVEDGSGKAFDQLRNHFQSRREFGFVDLRCAELDSKDWDRICQLGFSK